MFFTLEDYKKIYEWISRNSIRDTEFNEALTPLDETDTITLVLNGANVRISLKDLVDLLFLMGVSDFLNITDKYREKNITLDLAIELIPYTARKVGQVITFLDTNNKWKIYLFRGELTQWDLLNLWEDILDIEAHTINSILPDEEDLTKTLPDNKGNSYLSFKDREYNPKDFSGLGRVILRKNIVEIEDPIYGKVKKNILYQDMLTQSNTIYEIRYDFDLNGQEIVIPDDCVLDFRGGSLSNGAIIGNNTNVFASFNIVIFNNIIVQGTFSCLEVYDKWFQNLSFYNIMTNLIRMGSHIHVLKSYSDSFTSNILVNKSCTFDFHNNTIYITPRTVSTPSHEFIFYSEALSDITEKRNISFKNLYLKSSAVNHVTIEHPGYYSGISFFLARDCDNLMFENIHTEDIDYCIRAGYYVIGATGKDIDSLTIRDCYFDSHMMGIQLMHIKQTLIENCYFNNDNQESSLEHSIYIIGEMDNLMIQNCTFDGSRSPFNLGSSALATAFTENVEISNCTFNLETPPSDSNDYSFVSNTYGSQVGKLVFNCCTVYNLTGYIQKGIYNNCTFNCIPKYPYHFFTQKAECYNCIFNIKPQVTMSGFVTNATLCNCILHINVNSGRPNYLFGISSSGDIKVIDTEINVCNIDNNKESYDIGDLMMFTRIGKDCNCFIRNLSISYKSTGRILYAVNGTIIAGKIDVKGLSFRDYASFEKIDLVDHANCVEANVVEISYRNNLPYPFSIINKVLYRLDQTNTSINGPYKGFQGFNQKPIWWTGTKWIDSNGSDV